MGFYLCIGQCHACRQMFGFHPDKVPSMRDEHGVRQPVCKICIDRLNALLRKKGHAEVKILPGAYDAAEEGEL